MTSTLRWVRKLRDKMLGVFLPTGFHIVQCLRAQWDETLQQVTRVDVQEYGGIEADGWHGHKHTLTKRSTFIAPCCGIYDDALGKRPIDIDVFTKQALEAQVLNSGNNEDEELGPVVPAEIGERTLPLASQQLWWRVDAAALTRLAALLLARATLLKPVGIVRDPSYRVKCPDGGELILVPYGRRQDDGRVHGLSLQLAGYRGTREGQQSACLFGGSMLPLPQVTKSVLGLLAQYAPIVGRPAGGVAEKKKGKAEKCTTPKTKPVTGVQTTAAESTPTTVRPAKCGGGLTPKAAVQKTKKPATLVPSVPTPSVPDAFTGSDDPFGV